MLQVYRKLGGLQIGSVFFIYLFCRDVSASDSLACIILSVSNGQSVSASAPFKQAVSKVKIYIICIFPSQKSS